ncbi:hypothetical protein ACFFGF_06895 [Asaia lannensis]|uniref:Transposase n=1 Tax=Asaia lannensis NBRC 102526 TaxID=1307926 RepID=A0ABT1CLD2_9PROT|nr:hypothetical protein [Asaia lannensis]MCO6160814.1 hypothetical protein [Asaia lannensis NBRC 102526]
MRISKDRPGRGKAFRATTGEELVALLARKDRDAEKSVSRPVAVMEEERDETGALPAGHCVTWGALWRGEQMPVYRDVCGYGRWLPRS